MKKNALQPELRIKFQPGNVYPTDDSLLVFVCGCVELPLE